MIKKWCAAVAKPAIVTCFARQKIRNIGYGFSLHKEDIMIECACGAVTILDRNVVSCCGKVQILVQSMAMERGKRKNHWNIEKILEKYCNGKNNGKVMRKNWENTGKIRCIIGKHWNHNAFFQHGEPA